MPSRLRDKHLAQVLEALIRYVVAENSLTLVSERETDALHINFTLADADAYHDLLSKLMLEDEYRGDVPNGR